MNEQNQNKPKQRPEETPKNALGGTSAAKSSSGWRSLFAKRWVSPALFMAAAAIIVTLLWIYQGADTNTDKAVTSDPTEETQGDGQTNAGEEGALPVIAGNESMEWPVNTESLTVKTPFYDDKLSATEQEDAIVEVGDNKFVLSTGMDFVDPTGKTFDVAAALSGTVTKVYQHPTNGLTVEISHGEELSTVYQSVSEVAVKEGDEVQQGTVIAKAGRNELQRDLGIHLHYETLVNGDPVNPNDFIKEQ
ncbi:M23 family metallopeptidase [Paenibacillus sp. YIM B09110]|uniref:M23 family metallopeptidase n=1 Tax=Paenibacillus sp. YIM B09110 TaxID=3126102 RepID=UPI00301CA5A6